MSDNQLKIKWVSSGLGIFFLSLFVAGAFFPIDFWAFNDPGLMGTPGYFILLLSAVLMIGFPFLNPWTFRYGKPVNENIIIGAVAIFSGIIVWLFPLHTNIFGDSAFVYRNLLGKVEHWDIRILEPFYNITSYNSKTGYSSFYSVINFFSFVTGAEGLDVVRGVEAVCATIWSATWMSLVFMFRKEGEGRLVFVLAGMIVPSAFLFRSHCEIYFLPMTFSLIFLLCFSKYFVSQKKLYLCLLIPLAYLNLKFHVISILILPLFILAFIHFFTRDKEKFNLKLTWKNVLLFYLTPAFAIGAIIYFGVTDSAFGTRFFSEENFQEALFLPLKASDQAPLDRYNLFSWSHVSDYFQTVINWSPASVFLLAFMFIGKKIKARINDPFVIIIATTLILYVMAFFVFNPLFGIPGDRDLFSMPLPFLLLSTLLMAQKIDISDFKVVIGPVLGIALLVFSGYVVLGNNDMLGRKIAYQGIRMFKTYWKGASSYLYFSTIMEKDQKKKMERMDEILELVTPYGVKGTDIELTEVYSSFGKYYADTLGDHQKAIELFEAGVNYAPFYAMNNYRIVISRFMTGDFKAASEDARRLVRYPYPDKQKALSIAIHVSVEAGNYIDALNYSKDYLREWPENDFIHAVHDSLVSARNPENVRRMFKSGK